MALMRDAIIPELSGLSQASECQCHFLSTRLGNYVWTVTKPVFRARALYSSSNDISDST